MWDVLVRTPRGSNNPRKFSMLLATFFVALLGYVFATAPSAYAADASWEGNDLVYDSRTYEPVISDPSFPNQVKASPAIYRSVDTSTTPNVVHFIYFADGTTDAKDEKEATYVRYTLNPPNRYGNPADKKTISLTPANTAADTDDGAVTDTCTLDGIGWIVCPVMQGIAEGMDFVYNRIRGFLTVQPITASVDNPIYRIWSYSRDLANIAFVIGFMVIIYSFLVGGGFNGYEIRKILPRLVAAAVLINVSYLLCAVAVDASNIAGASVNQLFENVRDEVLPGSSAGDNVDVNWTSVTATVLAGGAGVVAGANLLPGVAGGGAATGGIVTGLWYLLAPFLFGAALLIIVTFFILAARQAIIIVLIAIAPLAFAAFILPNTEKWFERWRSVFFTMLIMFPAFGAVFGGAQLAGEVIIRTANSIEQIILGLGVMVAPLAITPLLLKLGGGVLNRFGGIVNNPRKGLYDRYKNYNHDRLAEQRASAQANNANMLAAGSFRRRQFVRRRAATNFAKKNFREEQKKQDEENAMNAWHRQTGQWGYDNHDKRGSDDNRTWYGARENGYGNLDMYKRRNALQHDYTNKHHDEHWETHLQSAAGVGDRQMLTDTRLMEGRAKVRSGAMEAQDERTFQTALNTDGAYANLRDMKVQTSVDAGVADIQKSAIEAAGKLALSTTVSGNQGLVDIKTQTFANEKRAETLDNIIKVSAERAYVQSSEGRTLNIRSQIAQDNLEFTKAEEAAIIQEWRTKKGAENLSGESATLAEALHLADYGKRIETQRAGAARRQSDIEYAIDLTEVDSNGVPTTEAMTLAQKAGGVEGETGATQARAIAFQTIVDAQNKGVAAARTLLSRVDNDDLLGTGPNGLAAANILDRPTEHISAIASTIAGRMHQKSHILLWEQMSVLHKQAADLVTSAEASGDADALADAKDKLGKIKDLQQQVMGDKKRTPFGAGDRDQGQATTGDYEGNIYESTRARILTHMSGKRLSETDPDDLRLIFEMARAGKLGNDHMAKLAAAYNEWKTDDNLKSSIEDKHRFLLDPLERYAQTNDLSTIPTPGSQAPQGAAPGYWNTQFANLDQKISNP